jgi:hypothetical protein
MHIVVCEGGIDPRFHQVPFRDAISGTFCMGGGGSKNFGTQNNLSENNFTPKSYADDVRSQTGSVGI